MIRFLVLAMMALASPVLAQTVQSPEEKQARLELLAGQSMYELGQLRVQVIQLTQQIEALKAKCGQPCQPQPSPQEAPK